MNETGVRLTLSDKNGEIYIKDAPVLQDERTTKYWVQDDEGELVELWQIVNDADTGVIA